MRSQDIPLVLTSAYATTGVVLLSWVLLSFLTARGFGGLTHALRATTYFNAFLLNALAPAIAVAVAVVVSQVLSRRQRTQKDISSFTTGFVTICTSLASTFAAYVLLFVVFGYGSGQFAAV